MAAQDFIGIDSTAAEPARPQDTAAQIPAALYQRAEQNSRYLMEWRGPTCVWHYPADYSGDEGVGPSFPKLAFANWAAFGPYRYHVPDVGTGAIPSVDVQIVGNVFTRNVRVAMVSNQGLGFIPNSEWLDANAQTVAPGFEEILFSGVAVVPGWNDLFLLLESEAEWSTVNFADDWYLVGGDPLSSTLTNIPHLVSTAGDLAISCPDINKPVPFVAIRFGSGLTDKDQDLASGSVCTIAFANCDASNPPVVEFAYLAELNSWGRLDGVATNSPGAANVYWSTLGNLEIYSVAVTPYANHPDKANDPTLRFLQSIGSNVANVYWKASRLNALRQTQVGSGVPRQLGSDYNGVWKALARSVSPYVSPGELIRETSISTRGVQPTEDDGAVSIEMSIPVISLSSLANGRRPITFDARLELFNVTTGAVVDYIEYNNLAFPASSYYAFHSMRDNFSTDIIAANYWLRRVALLTEVPDWRGATSVQPWSHDGATALADMTSTFYPLILRLPLGDDGNSPDNWKTIRQSGDLFSVRFFIKDYSTLSFGIDSDFLGFGAMTARIDWGT
jgi:hypothetical protein